MFRRPYTVRSRSGSARISEPFMTAHDLAQLVSHAIFLAIAVVAIAEAVRRPRRSNLDVAAFFALLAFAILEDRVADALGLPEEAFFRGAVLVVVVAAVPFAMLRLVDDFAEVPSWVLRLAGAGLVLLAIGAFLPPPRPIQYTVAFGAYFLAFMLYSAVALVSEARRSTGVTRRRLQAAGSGSLLLGLTIAVAVVDAFTPDVPDAATVVWLLALGSGLAYYIGFAPPRVLRRAWQEPELRAFLAGAARLPRLPDTLAIVAALERGAAHSTGARASIGLWREQERVLRFWDPQGQSHDVEAGRFIAGKAFAERREIFTTNAERDDPESAQTYRENRVASILAAPIAVGDRALGVLTVHSERSPIFAEDDLELVKLLADQAAVVLESRALIDEAARVRAQEEATRLKEDFLSAAAHDLRTPLTTILTQAQLLERHAEREPAAPADLGGIRRLVAESRRLNALVVELLDAARAERGRLVGPRERVDLAALLREVAEQRNEERRVSVEADGTVQGLYDPARLRQLLDNLLENALKYSPEAGRVSLRLWREGDLARIAVEDRGIGIPPDDLPHVFERFRRGGNVDDRRFAGMGLGLYICRGIAEQHGGRIWAESTLGHGSTFHVALPARPSATNGS